MTVISVGSINADFAFRVDRFPTPGETIASSALGRSLGGKGANQAVAAARAGATTIMIGALGDDATSGDLRAALAGYGVDTGNVVALPGSPSGMAHILVSDQDNMIVVHAGANESYDGAIPEHLVSAGATVLMQFEIGFAAIESAVQRLSDARHLIINAAPAMPGGEVLFGLFDLLIVNETELAAFAGKMGEDPVAQARSLLTGRLGAVIVTLGAQGALRIDRGSSRQFDSPLVKAIDTTGAGDCFCGVLAAGLDGGRELDEAILMATRAAAISVTRPGAAPSMPDRIEIEIAMLQAGGQ